MRVLSALTAFGLMTGAAMAQSAPPLSAIIKSFEDKGYVISDIDIDAGEIEIEARNAEGRKVEIDVDRATGNVLREKLDD